jgi:hypothetical protein
MYRWSMDDPCDFDMLTIVDLSSWKKYPSPLRFGHRQMCDVGMFTKKEDIFRGLSADDDIFW